VDPPPTDQHTPRWLLSALLVLPALALAGAMIYADRAAAAPPVASFTLSPTSPVTGETVTFTSTSTDPNGDLDLLEWDLDGNGRFNDGEGPTATWSFPVSGQRTVTLRATDLNGDDDTASRTFTVRANAAPTVAFSAAPASPETGQAVTLTSTSRDPDGRPLLHEWDLDDDGAYDDGTDSPITTSFPAKGPHTVWLRVTDSGGLTRTASLDITVRNRAPAASFRYTPAAPLTGDEVRLTSTSTDRDGTVQAHNWDLDGDGAFDDATGAEVRTSFAEAGSHIVSLQAVDNDGARSATAFASIDVARRPAPTAFDLPLAPPAPTSRPAATGPRVLSPLPRVRVRGVTTATGARIDFLGVRTRGGTRIRVLCRGRGCPWARNLQRARFRTSVVRTVRVRGFKRRHLRAGAVVEVFVTRPAMIGKYMRLKIRPGMKPPKRVDGCTSPGGARVRKCPAA
jgi:PKD repeat protein